MGESENNGITVVEMSYGRVTMRVDKLLLDLMTRHEDYVDKRFIRKKDACFIYDLNPAEVMRYAAEAGALYKRNKMVMIKLDAFDEYMLSKLRAEQIAKAEAATKQKNCFPTCPWYHGGEDNYCLLHK